MSLDFATRAEIVEAVTVDGFDKAYGSASMTTLKWIPVQSAVLLIIRPGTASKVAISRARAGTIAEFVVSQARLGYIILQAESLLQTVRVFASVILPGVIGTAHFYPVELGERLACPWQVSHRGEARAQETSV